MAWLERLWHICLRDLRFQIETITCVTDHQPETLGLIRGNLDSQRKYTTRLC